MNENQEKDNGFLGSTLRRVLALLIVVVITSSLTYTITIKVGLQKEIDRRLSRVDMEYMSTKMSLVKTALEESYIRDFDEDKMIESAIKGYVSGAGDKYTQYLDKQDMNDLMEATFGSYVGIGVYMANISGMEGVVIIGLVEDSVAEKAGIQVGDIIVKVDDENYLGKKSSEVTDALRGDEGAEVKLTIKRDSEEIEFKVKREQVKVKTIASKMLDNGIAYIRITSFDVGTANEFKEHYKKLKEQNPKGLILDLRSNGGGVVSEAVDIADTMIEQGKTILITRDKNGNEKIDKAKIKPEITIPVVVLVNGTTASSSEILACALRDDCGFKIVGTNSYGKGVIQNIAVFNDGTGIKITSNEYFSPNHNVINEVGIEPDYDVELDKEWRSYSVVPYENDKQLQKAVELLM